MHYTFRFPNRFSRYADINFRIEGVDAHTIELHLPTWRPGRYERANFAKNIRSWKAFGPHGEELKSVKTSSHTWQVFTEGVQSVSVRYEYHCAQPDAGACWIDEELVYINPVHCCLYLKERMHEPCTVQLDLPSGLEIACSLKSPAYGVFEALDFHELVDSPWMAARTFHHRHYDIHGTRFHVWMHGNAEPDWSRIINDFSAFSRVQIDTMGGLPVDEYHFLVLLLPYRFYHGVEHLRSTVLALGPGHELMEPSIYDDFTGVASHELFHVWNVKCIRPADLLPYDYARENYSRLGYVYEGVTTYYGDLFLSRASVYDVDRYFGEIDLRLKKHFDSYGRLHMPVAEASFDTWLDGYVPGVPHRKTSIYDEGSIVALMTDLLIRSSSKDQYSLDDVMRTLYNDFGKKGHGYKESDYRSIAEQFAGRSLKEFFEDYVHGTASVEPLLKELLAHVGCRLVREPSDIAHERRFGFRAVREHDRYKVTSVLPGSPADKAGLSQGDELLALNDEELSNELASYFTQEGREEKLVVRTPMKRIREFRLVEDGANHFPVWQVKRLSSVTPAQRTAFQSWSGQSW